MGWWLGGFVVDKNGPSNFLILKDARQHDVLIKMSEKLSAAITLKFMGILSFNIWIFKADYLGWKQRKIMMVTEGVSSRRNVSKGFKDYPDKTICSQIQEFRSKSLKKKFSVQNVLNELLITSYEQLF